MFNNSLGFFADLCVSNRTYQLKCSTWPLSLVSNDKRNMIDGKAVWTMIFVFSIATASRGRKRKSKQCIQYRRRRRIKCLLWYCITERSSNEAVRWLSAFTMVPPPRITRSPPRRCAQTPRPPLPAARCNIHPSPLDIHPLLLCAAAAAVAAAAA